MIKTSGTLIVADAPQVKARQYRRPMAGTSRPLLVALVACAALVTAPVASAAGYIDDEPSAEAMILDGLVARPLGLAATLLGAAAWVVTLPFSLLGRNSMEAGQAMVVEPAAFTFTRPLGDL